MPKAATQADTQAPEVQAPQGTQATAAAAAPAEDKEYAVPSAGLMIDPETQIRFTGVPVKSPLTNWLKCQVEAGKIVEQATEPPAE
jgi:hypothetical protein